MASVFKRTPKSSKWTGEYRDLLGKLRRVALCADKSASQTAFNKFLDAMRQAEAGRTVRPDDVPALLSETFYTHVAKAGLSSFVPSGLHGTINSHVDDYDAHLSSKGTAERHRRQSIRNIKLCFAKCRFARLADIKATPVERYLSLLMAESDGRGKDGDKRRKMSPTTRNSHLKSVKAFTNWCVKTGRLSDNPLTTISKLNEAKDVRVERRAMTTDELARLIYVAENRPLAELGRKTVPTGQRNADRRTGAKSGRRKGEWVKEPLDIDNMPVCVERARVKLAGKPERIAKLEREGRQRRLVYEVAVYTGLRRSELAGLRWRDVELDGASPVLVVPASLAKSGKAADVPLRASLAASLRAWRDDRDKLDPMAPVFDNVPQQLLQRMKRDLQAAGIPFIDECGRRLDVHALRHTTATWLSESGVAPRDAQAIMRHSKIDLTMRAYTHPSARNLSRAVESMPGEASRPDRQEEKATGTFGKRAG